LTDFLTLLGEQLHQLTLDAPVIAVELSIADAAIRPTASRSLFPEPAQWSNNEHRLVDLLCARLGAENILQARPQADYRPELANHWVCMTNARSDGRPDTQALPCLPAHSRPFWLLPAPLPLATRNNHPVYNGAPLNLIQGPERLESGWWSEPGHELRDYFIAQDQYFARYWVYRQRESLRARWFLHGLFG
jgi:protein ImuB